MTACTYPMLTFFDRVIPAAVRADGTQLQAARHLTLLAAVTALSVPLLTLMYHLLGYDAVGMMVLTAGIVMMVSPFTLAAGLAALLGRWCRPVVQGWRWPLTVLWSLTFGVALWRMVAFWSRRPE